MRNRFIQIYVKDEINLTKLMAAIFRQYEPSIDKIELFGVDTPLDREVLSAPKPPDSITYKQVKEAIKNTFNVRP